MNEVVDIHGQRHAADDATDAMNMLSHHAQMLVEQVQGPLSRLVLVQDEMRMEIEWSNGDADDTIHEDRMAGLRPPQPATSARYIRAPQIGRFHAGAQPGGPAYVVTGQSVEEDTVIGTIETMRIHSAVAAGISGTVTAVLVEDGQMTEYDQPIVEIEPREHVPVPVE